MTVKERLKLFLKSKKISERKFTSTIGVSNGYVSSMRKSIQPDKLASIALHYPDLDHNWLLTGIGQMLKDLPNGKTLENSGNAVVSDKETTTSRLWEKYANGLYRLRVDVVSIADHRNYLKTYMQYLTEWEQITFSVSEELRSRGHFLGFRHIGDHMFNPDNPSFYDIKNGMVSLARELERWRWEKEMNKSTGKYGWIFVTNKEIIHRDVEKVNLVEGVIYCTVRNSTTKEQDVILNVKDIYQAFQIITVIH